MKVNDITEYTATVFGDLDVEDYFTNIVNRKIIWRKIDGTTAIQITNDTTFSTISYIAKDVAVQKVEITSIEYRRIK